MKKEEIKINNLYVCYCLLKKENSGKEGNERLQQMTEKLYEAQAFYENAGAVVYQQAFVFGNREAAVRPFFEYDYGFRTALDECVERYPISDALLLSYAALKDYMPTDEEKLLPDVIKDVYRLVIIGDYPLDTESEAVDILIGSINQLKKNCNFKVCYIDTDEQDRAGNLDRMIDSRGLE